MTSALENLFAMQLDSAGLTGYVREYQAIPGRKFRFDFCFRKERLLIEINGGIVFDPFVGSGTTVATAIQLGRKGIGIDLSLTYLYENAKDRIEAEILPLLTLIEQE